MSKTKGWLIGMGSVLVIGAIVFALCYKIVTIKGNELGVLETWTHGVVEEPLLPKTHFLDWGFTKEVYRYDMSSQVYVMNDKSDANEPFADGLRHGAYTVQSAEGQNMTISATLRWRRDPDKIIYLHTKYQDNIGERLLRPELQATIKNSSTRMQAIDAYSGEGLVRLQTDIEDILQDKNGTLASSGIIVEGFVIEDIQLDDNYIAEIKARQVAVQRELRARQEEKAALADAEKAKAEAQADYNRQIVAAERDKAIGILEAEKEQQMKVLAAKATAEQQVIEAKAQAEKTVLNATAQRDAQLLEAEGILALGKSKAEATQLQMTAYSVAGSENYVTMEVAKSLADGYRNIAGYLPSDMNISVLSENYMKGVQVVVDPLKQNARLNATQQPVEKK